LHGIIYHFLYIYETIEYLLKFAIDDDDKSLLKDTFDSLQPIKFELKQMNYNSSQRRPIEASFRMYQPHHHIQMLLNQQQDKQQQQQQQQTTVSYLNTTISSHVMSIITATQIGGMRRQALASNINELTEAKWREIEMNVESFTKSNVSLFPNNNNNSNNNNQWANTSVSSAGTSSSGYSSSSSSSLLVKKNFIRKNSV
jgi:hypothetical protein